MVHCKTLIEGDHIVKQLYHMLLNVDDKPCTVIKTANTVTFARSWPERHVQVVLYVMEHISDMLLFADLDCAVSGVCPRGCGISGRQSWLCTGGGLRRRHGLPATSFMSSCRILRYRLERWTPILRAASLILPPANLMARRMNSV